MSKNFAPVQTDVGFAEMIRSNTSGQDWYVSHIAIGDASGTSYVPTVAQTELKNEKMRAPLLDASNFDEGFRVVSQFDYDADIGNFEIREIGFYIRRGDHDPVLWGVYSTPDQIIDLMREGTKYVAAFNVAITRGDTNNLVLTPDLNPNRDFNLANHVGISTNQIKLAATQINQIIKNSYKFKGA